MREDHFTLLRKVQSESAVVRKPWIPAFAGMTDEGILRIACHSREGGNPSAFADRACASTRHANRRLTCRHSREGRNPQVVSRTHRVPKASSNRSVAWP